MRLHPAVSTPKTGTKLEELRGKWLTFENVEAILRSVAPLGRRHTAVYRQYRRSRADMACD